MTSPSRGSLRWRWMHMRSGLSAAFRPMHHARQWDDMWSAVFRMRLEQEQRRRDAEG